MIGYISLPDAKSIAPVGMFITPMCEWASQYPNMYKVSTTNVIYYYNDAALSWWVLRWGDGATLEVSDIMGTPQ